MNQLAQNVLDIIQDYRNTEGVQLTQADIIDWANQFGEDAAFMLIELSHILPKAYFSKERVTAAIKLAFRRLARDYGYNSIQPFLSDTSFLNVQPPQKSQGALLEILESILQEDYQESYIAYNDSPKRNFVYFDDVLATGGTVSKDLIYWLQQTQTGATKTNVQFVLDGEFKLSVFFLCIHNWGLLLLQQRLNATFRSNKLSERILWQADYIIENHLQKAGQSLNTAIPISSGLHSRSHLYLQHLQQNIHEPKFAEYAYRNPSYPANEVFFTSPENRIKYENLLIEKGLDIIGMIQDNAGRNIRPLGFIYPDYLTFGLGTHFFTWRKIPNNCPLVFWWEVQGHDWKPLFPVRRG